MLEYIIMARIAHAMTKIEVCIDFDHMYINCINNNITSKYLCSVEQN